VNGRRLAAKKHKTDPKNGDGFSTTDGTLTATDLIDEAWKGLWCCGWARSGEEMDGQKS